MQLAKLSKLLLIIMCSMSVSDLALADNNNNQPGQILKNRLDSSDTIVGDAVKGTGNIIKATRKTVKNISGSVDKSVENNQ